jgi:cleavage stimulation factor subunit 3
MKPCPSAQASRSVCLPPHLPISFLIHSFLFTFTYAEAQALKQEYEEVHATLDRLFMTLQLEQLSAARSRENGFTETFRKSTRNGCGTNAGTWSSNMTFNMFSAWRAEGLKASRAMFGRVRKIRWAPWKVYQASGTYLLVLLR